MCVMKLISRNYQMTGRQKLNAQSLNHNWFSLILVTTWSTASKQVSLKNIGRSCCRRLKKCITGAVVGSRMGWLLKRQWMETQPNQMSLNPSQLEPRVKIIVAPIIKNKGSMKLISSKPMDITSMSFKVRPSQSWRFQNLEKLNLQAIFQSKVRRFR